MQQFSTETDVREYEARPNRINSMDYIHEPEVDLYALDGTHKPRILEDLAKP